MTAFDHFGARLAQVLLARIASLEAEVDGGARELVEVRARLSAKRPRAAAPALVLPLPVSLLYSRLLQPAPLSPP